MFWLFGGNNQFGTASLAYYNGSSLAVNEDVVVVAINYRTNSMHMPVYVDIRSSILTHP